MQVSLSPCQVGQWAKSTRDDVKLFAQSCVVSSFARLSTATNLGQGQIVEDNAFLDWRILPKQIGVFTGGTICICWGVKMLIVWIHSWPFKCNVCWFTLSFFWRPPSAKHCCTSWKAYKLLNYTTCRLARQGRLLQITSAIYARRTKKTLGVCSGTEESWVSLWTKRSRARHSHELKISVALSTYYRQDA